MPTIDRKTTPFKLYYIPHTSSFPVRTASLCVVGSQSALDPGSSPSHAPILPQSHAMYAMQSVLLAFVVTFSSRLDVMKCSFLPSAAHAEEYGPRRLSLLLGRRYLFISHHPHPFYCGIRFGYYPSLPSHIGLHSPYAFLFILILASAFLALLVVELSEYVFLSIALYYISQHCVSVPTMTTYLSQSNRITPTVSRAL